MTASRWLRFGWRHKGTIVLGSASAYVGYSIYDNRGDILLMLESIRRVSRTAGCTVQIIANYKLAPLFYGSSLEDCHEWGAKRLLRLLTTQRGVYIKLGQHIASLDYLLPTQYCTTMHPLFQMAPQSSRADIEGVFEAEMRGRYGIPLRIDEVFSEWDWERPLGVASLAQVHRARLRNHPQHQEVAVKIQHPYVRTHAAIDIRTVQLIVRGLKWAFPSQVTFDWLAEEMARNLPAEMDFVREGGNAERMAEIIRREPKLRGKCFVPAIWWPATAPRVLTMELVPKGHMITDKGFLKQNNISGTEVMETVSRLFAVMIFKYGFVHCDPHPGNLLLTINEGEWKLALLDHGLYKELERPFRLAYARMWCALLEGSEHEIRKASLALGSSAHRLFTCILTHRTWSSDPNIPYESGYVRPRGLRSLMQSTSEVEESVIRKRAALYLTDLGKLLAEVPRPLLLLLKTNDLLKALERSICTTRSRSLLMMAQESLRAVYINDGSSDMWWSGLVYWWRWVRLRVLWLVYSTLYE